MADQSTLRVGAFNVGEYSFWGIWAPALSAASEVGSPLLDMRITSCWDVNPKLAEAFAEEYGCAVARNYDDMLGSVDAVAFGGLYEVPWQHEGAGLKFR